MEIGLQYFVKYFIPIVLQPWLIGEKETIWAKTYIGKAVQDSTRSYVCTVIVISADMLHLPIIFLVWGRSETIGGKNTLETK